jgi:peptidoglycan/LPS O-acetylase OafA/YrhL
LFHHLTIYRPTSGIDEAIASVPLFGWVGVDLFFVLSGFLITGILMDARGHAHYFRNFYMRRALRIFPLYYLVLFLALIVLPQFPALHTVLVGPYELPPQWPYWLYLTNFSVAQRELIHGILDLTWSLAIEEQFYLVWAVVVWLCPPRRLAWLCAGIILAEPIARTFALVNDVRPLSVYVLTWFRLDGLATGALLAWLMRHESLKPLERWAPWAAAVGAMALAAIAVDSDEPWWWTSRMQQYGYALIAWTAGAMLVSAVTRPPDSTWPRLLSAGWLRAFGKYSYCLYLTHLPVMRAMREYVFDPFEFNALAIAPWIAQVLFYVEATVPALVLAWVSWRVFEAPILRLKERFPY